MGQVLVRNVSDAALDCFRDRAKLKGTSLEQELRALIEGHAAYSPEERVAVSRAIQAMTPGIIPPLTLEEIRDGLE